MIDKTQSSRGMRFRIKGSDVALHPCTASIQLIEARHDFVGWTLEDSGISSYDHDDYEVDKEGRLIRLGHQIDEDRFPCAGLKMLWEDQQTGEFKVCTPYEEIFKTVADVEKTGVGFLYWAETDRNRELGLWPPKPRKSPKTSRLDKLEAAGKKWNDRISARDHQKMVETQNKSLGCDYAAVERRVCSALGVPKKLMESLTHDPVLSTTAGVPDREWFALDEQGNISLKKSGLRVFLDKKLGAPLTLYKHTTYIKAHLPDGRIIESPRASAEDGWEEYDHYQWQIGEAGIGSVMQKPNVSARILDVFDHDGTKQDTLLLPFERDEDQCWAKDMLPILLTQEKTGDVIKYTSILEVRMFRKPLFRKRNFVDDLSYGDPARLMQPLEADYGEYNDSCWPDGSHPRHVLFESKK